MKIGIDISQLAFQGTGVATYTENLVTNLIKIDKENEYIFFYSSLRQKLPLNLKQSLSLRDKSSIPASPTGGLNLKSFHIPPLILELLWNRFHLIPIETFTGKLDVFHSSDWLEPPSRCPKITTIHDLAIFKYSEVFVPKGGHDIIQNQKRKLEWVKKETKIIIAVSENTKKDIIDILKIPEEKIKVVYEASDAIYGKQQTTENIEKTKKKYGINGKYLLAVGTLEPRKNLKRIIEAYKIIVSQFPDLSLVVVGKMGWGEDIEKWQMANARPPASSPRLPQPGIGGQVAGEVGRDKCQIKFLGYVPKEDLAGLYQKAECFVYPSLYEGFGLPVLDAMASGCPVVTSNVSSLPEVAGDAGILVNPEDVGNIAEGIKEALKQREILIKKGLVQASKFSWEKTARETLAVYREAHS